MIPEGERPIKIVIGQNVERYFLDSEFSSLSKFADSIGLDTVRVRKIMAGESSVSVEKLQQIAAVLNIKTLDLIEDWSEL